MKATYLTTAGAIALAAIIAACSAGVQTIAPSTAPAPVAIPAPAPSHTSMPTPVPTAMATPASATPETAYDNYLDAPQTPGTWEYEDEPGEKLALFAQVPSQPVFLLRCAAGSFALGRVTDTPQSTPRIMSVTAETVTRQLTVQPVPGRERILAASIDANDPLLDAIAITKGRFVIEVEGQRTLYLPAWVEVSRVIEDCR